MKRMHIHIAVEDLATAIRFYSSVFGQAPDVEKSDYAKWMPEDPRVNFAISARGAAPGLNHLGIQVESDAELQALAEALEAGEARVVAEPGTTCCYARSDKYWATDPAGIAWESYRTLGEVPLFNAESASCETGCAPSSTATPAAGCCTPQASRAGS